jgi:hypothetical protein
VGGAESRSSELVGGGLEELPKNIDAFALLGRSLRPVVRAALVARASAAHVQSRVTPMRLTPTALIVFCSLLSSNQLSHNLFTLLLSAVY